MIAAAWVVFRKQPVAIALRHLNRNTQNRRNESALFISILPGCCTAARNLLMTAVTRSQKRKPLVQVSGKIQHGTASVSLSMVIEANASILPPWNL